MGDTLFGGFQSGTPVETRGGTSDLARVLRGSIQGGDLPFQDLVSRQLAALFGPDFQVGAVAQDLLADPRSRTAGLFRSLEPFERRQEAESVAELRQQFGTLGGRFGRNIAESEALLRGELAGQRQLTREQALLQADQQRAAALAAILQAATQAAGVGTQGLDVVARFLQPGEPVFREGIFADLLKTGGNIAASQIAAAGAA